MRMRSDKGFSNWMDDRNRNDDKDETFSFLGIGMQMKGVQENFASQMMELSGALPDTPLNENFRNRLSASVYLLLGSIGFGVLAIVVGLPTLILKPAKFIMLMTLSTIFGFASVIVMKKPFVFLSELYEAGIVKSTPFICLVMSMFVTIYTTIVIHRYLYVIIVGGIQILCMLWFMSQFIPGGSTGLKVLLQTAWVMIKTTMTPCIYLVKRKVSSIFAG